MAVGEKLGLEPYKCEEAQLLSDQNVEKRQERQKSRSMPMLVIASVLLVLVFLAYTRTPLHAMNCIHHIRKHSNFQVDDSLSPLPKHQNVPRSLEEPSTTEFCQTDACKQYAQTILTNMSPKWKELDPCNNFDALTCDGFRETHNYKDYKSRVSTMDLVHEDVEAILLGLFNGSIPYKPVDEKDQANWNTMKTVYDTCMNEDAIKKYGIEPVQKVLADYEKIFPANGAPLTSENTKELTDAAIWAYRKGGLGLFSVHVTTDFNNPDSYLLGFSAGGLNLAKKQYEKNPTLLEKLGTAISEMQQVLKSGKPLSEAPMSKEDEIKFKAYGQKSVEFEKYIASHLPEPNMASNNSYYNHHTTLSEVEKLIPQIDLTRYLKAIVPDSYNIGPNLTIQINDINYYKNLSAMIKETPRETIHNYVANRIIKRYSGHVHTDYYMPLIRLDNINNGLKLDNVPPRWRTCLGAVDGHLEFMYGGLYVDHAFTAKDKILGDKITHELREEFQNRLKALDWLSSEAKPTGLRKVDTMIQKIGYQANHPNISDPQEVFDYYKPKIRIVPSATWFQLQEMFGDAENKAIWEKFLKPVDQLLWTTNAPTVNAFYSPSTNSITFPAGIMRSPIFSAKLPDYVSYGSFGAVAGHEVTHSFDDNGSNYDDKRKYRNWWDQKTKDNFHKRTQCFIDQYSNFTVEGLKPGERIHVDGKLTLSENIADAGGLNAAYEAWKHNSKNNQLLPGLERFTTDQMFFVSFGNFWCSKMRKERQINSVFSDAHSPANVRILGTTANTAAFRKAFNCPVKEPTCSLW